MLLVFHAPDVVDNIVYEFCQLPELFLTLVVNTVLSQDAEFAQTVVNVFCQLPELDTNEEDKLFKSILFCSQNPDVVDIVVYEFCQLAELLLTVVVSTVLSHDAEFAQTVVKVFCQLPELDAKDDDRLFKSTLFFSQNADVVYKVV